MRHENRIHERESAVSPVIGVILMVAITVILAAVIGTFVLGLGDNVQETPSAGIGTDQEPGELTITIVTPGNIDSAQLGTPTGTRSSVLSEGLETGAKLTLRSNGTVFTFVKENNVTIANANPGIKTADLDTLSDIPNANLLLQEFGPSAGSTADEYTQRSAYLACLFNHGGFEVGSTEVPSSISIPCHTPALAEESDDVIRGTTGQTPGTTVPILLEQGEYQLFGQVGGDQSVITSVEVDEETAQAG